MFAVFGDSGIVVDLVQGAVTGEGDDVIRSIENLKGGAGQDILIGTSGSNILWDGAGDTLSGGDGDDIYVITDPGVVI